MQSIEICRTVIDYNYALYERLWASIDQLTEAQFTQEFDYSHGSVRNQMVHVVLAEKRWLLGLQGDPQARNVTLDPADYPTRRSVRALWEARVKEMRAYLDRLEEADLARTLPGMGGPVWQVLVHLANHGTDHRAQILRALHQLGAPTFDQDMVFYLWPR